MSPSRKPNAPSSPAGAPTPAGHVAGLVIPRTWLVGITALLMVPWLIVGWNYRSGSAHVDAAPGPEPTATADPRGGPWGRLDLTPIIVSPPIEYVAADWNRGARGSEWRFPSVSRDMLQAFLTTSGFDASQVGRVMAAATPEASTGGLVVRPDAELVRSLSTEQRARLYNQLAKSPLNIDQANAFRFAGASPEAWLAGSLISPDTRQLLQPLIYRNGEYLLFADPALLLPAIDSPDERQRLAKVLLRQATLLVRLTVDDAARVPSLAEYWGRGGRATDVRPLLESLTNTRTDHSIDIVHLLPSFARNRLYRYPKPTTADDEKPLLANCLWTVLNFFRDVPDDRFLDVPTALETLRRDYYVVESDFRLGDVVALVDDDGDLFHAAVYLADDLVFTKNGTSPVAPWIIMPTGRLIAFYAHRSSDPRLIYHRRSDL